MKKIKARIVDDSCLFCGHHSEVAGGHYYEGYANKKGHIEAIKPKDWIIIPHLSGCEIQICPECVKKIKSVGILV